MTEGLRPALTIHAPGAPPAPWGAPWRGINRSLARHGPRAWLIGLLLLAFMTVVAAADVMPYDLTLKPTGNAAMDQALLDASLLASLREEAKAGAFALVSRANNDLPRLDDVLRSFGYYDAYIDIRLNGLPLDEPDLVARLEASAGAAPIPIQVAIDLGPLYLLGEVRLDGEIPAKARAAFTLEPGQPALAASVLAAGQAVLTALREEGYALAAMPAPEVIVLHATRTMDVTYTATPGPRLAIGPVTIRGLDRLKEDYVQRRLGLEPGEIFSPSRLERARRELTDSGVLSSARLIPGTEPDAFGRLPMTLEVTERPPRVLRFAGAYSSDEGGSVSASWTHRNLFGRAERLTLRADIGTLGAAYTNEPSYLVSIAFVKPDLWRRNDDLNLDLAAVREFLDAYDRDAISAGVSLQRRFTENLNAGLGLGMERSRITQDDITRDYNLAFLPLTLKYNGAGDLLDPREGARLDARVAPTQVLSGDASNFIHLRATGTAYLDLTRLTSAQRKSGRTIVAGRLSIGRIFGASADQVPPDWRFYAGGGGSVRGYPYQSIGPQTLTGQPKGGSNLLETSLELRQRLWGNWGGAIFADTGAVSDLNFPGTGTWAIGVGAGIRYHTPVGPVRLDLATPLSNDAGDPAVQVYIGIGQAY
ncbi:MAG: autotransporter assembly complex family protein [Chromatiaceae bacterium]